MFSDVINLPDGMDEVSSMDEAFCWDANVVEKAESDYRKRPQGLHPDVPQEIAEWCMALSDDEENSAPVELSTKPIKRKRMTADQEILSAAKYLSPETSGDCALPLLRRSKRLRTSIGIYHEQHRDINTKPRNSKVPDKHVKKLSTDEKQSQADNKVQISYKAQNPCPLPLTDASARQNIVENLCSIDDLMETNIDTANTLSPRHVLNVTYSPPIPSAILNQTFTIETKEENSFIITEELENLYRNKNYVPPTSKTYSTIFEKPRHYRGQLLIFSKGASRRSIDSISNSNFYEVPQQKLQLRRRKAEANGWQVKSESEHDQDQRLLEKPLKSICDNE